MLINAADAQAHSDCGGTAAVRPIPIVTIGMPVYNGERFVRQAIESVLAQTFVDFELLISDNASTDGTANICSELAAKDTRIRLVRQSANIGAFRNFRHVTDHAAAPLLVWLAHDDVLDSGYTERCVQQMRSNDRSVLVSSDFLIIDEGGNAIGTEYLTNIRADIPWHVRRTEFFKFPLYSNTFFCFYGMMRTDACRQLFDQLSEPKYLSQSELPFLVRLATAGEICSFPGALRSYRRVSTSVYHTEQKSLLGKPSLQRLAIQARHFFGLIADQISVLLRSSFPARTKAGILLRLVYYYGVECVVRLVKGRPPTNIGGSAE